ncbi:MAG: hypothetical protein ACYC0X_19945 [Pirellulaceae bacterium]
MIWLVILLLIVVPVCWLVSEFQSRAWLRISLGVAAIGMSYFVAWVVGSLTMLRYNAHYGSASAELVETVIANVEAGNDEPLLRELKSLKEEYHPTYENRANYDKLVNDFVSRMKAPPQQSGASDDAAPPE